MEFIQQNIYLVTIAVLGGIILLVTSLRRPGGGNSLSPTEATMLINREDALVIDVREAAEYINGHVPESRNIPAASLDERIGELDKFKDSPLILVCQSGTRSNGACSRLAKQGFSRVHNLDGGIGAWVQAGLPLKKGNKK